MSKGKNSQGHGKKELSLVRSSAAEYLTFVAAGGLFDQADHRKENMV